MIRSFFILFFVLCAELASSQVEVNGTLRFTSPNDSLRQANGLYKADSLNEAVSVNDAVYKRFFNQEVSVSDSVFVITTSFEFPAYAPGMSIFVKVPVLTDTVNVPSYIRINSYQTINIRGTNNSQVGAETVASGRILILLYNGSEFICTNQAVYSCPSGFKKMNENYCIQIDRNPLATFWNANKNCMDLGYHLCSFQEWYYACSNNAGLNSLPLNYEWVHTTSNHNIHALKIGSGTCKTTDSETTATTGLPMYYRCCYTLK
jgi:hypothetical protein